MSFGYGLPVNWAFLRSQITQTLKPLLKKRGCAAPGSRRPDADYRCDADTPDRRVRGVWKEKHGWPMRL